MASITIGLNPPTMSELLQRHKAYLPSHKPIPTFPEIWKAGGRLPRVAIITCADPRVMPDKFLNLDLAEAVIMRVPSGRAQIFRDSLIALDSLATFQEVMVIQHTDCGACVYRDAEIKKSLKDKRLGDDAEIGSMSFGEITTSIEENVVKSVKFLENTPYLREELRKNIFGFVYDLETGELKQVSSGEKP